MCSINTFILLYFFMYKTLIINVANTNIRCNQKLGIYVYGCKFTIIIIFIMLPAVREQTIYVCLLWNVEHLLREMLINPSNYINSKIMHFVYVVKVFARCYVSMGIISSYAQ